MKKILETKRLIAYAPNKNSLDNRLKLLSDPEVARYLRDGNVQPKEVIEAFVKRNADHYHQFGFCLFDIYEKDTNEFIGDAGLIHLALNSKNKDVELGYRLAKKYWNKGYATELGEAFIKWGFEEHKLEKIVACCKEKNTASSNVMKKCHMQYGGKYQYNGTHECDIYFIDNVDNHLVFRN